MPITTSQPDSSRAPALPEHAMQNHIGEGHVACDRVELKRRPERAVGEVETICRATHALNTMVE